MKYLTTSLGKIQYNKCDWIQTIIDKQGNEKTKIIPMKLSNYIRNNLEYIFVRGQASEACLTYIYVNGYYKIITDNELKRIYKTIYTKRIKKIKRYK